jgi:hypothetical protein
MMPSASAPYEITVASRTSEISVPALSTAAELKRMFPPFWPSVVDDASSICSAATRRMRLSCQPLPAPWRTRHATLV